MARVLEKTGNFGFNAQTEEYCDMVAEGIMDPTKVVRIALQDAASVAALLITTEAMVAEAPKKDAAAVCLQCLAAAAWAAWVAWTSKVRFTQASSSRSQIEPEKPQANAKPQIERSAVFLSNRCNRRPGRNNGRKQRLIDKQVEDKSSQEIHLSRGLKYARSLRALIV